MTTNRTDLAQLRRMTAAEAARLPVDHLAMLLEDSAVLKADASAVADKLTEACAIKFGPRADDARRMEGKDTGRVSFAEGDFIIRADRPKKVDWNQDKLAEAVETVKGWGENMSDYVAVKMIVAESKFTAWPTTIRRVFEPARTVGVGKVSFLIERRAA